MAINVQYGPISTALGLASQAGAGVARQRQREEELAYQEMLRRERETQGRDYANQIQAALQAQAGTRADQNIAIQQQRLQQEQQLAQQRMAAQQQAAAQKLALQQQRKVGQQTYISGRGTPEDLAYFEATGKIPETVVPQRPAKEPAPDKQLAAEYRRALAALRLADKQIAQHSYDPFNNEQMVAKTTESQNVKGAISGQEAKFQAAQAQKAEVERRLQEIDQQLAGEGLLPGEDVVAPGVINQIAEQRQTAPTQSPRFVAYARNPQTGERVGYDQNTGQWVKVP